MSMSYDDEYLHDLAKEQRLNLRKVAHCRHKWKFSRRVSYSGNSHTEHVIGTGHDIFTCVKCKWKKEAYVEREHDSLPLHGLSKKGGYVDGEKVRDRNI